MRGIAGIRSMRGVDFRHSRAMSTAISYRGPNGFGCLLCSDGRGVEIRHNEESREGVSHESKIGLAVRRFSIIDFSDQDMQPFLSLNQQLVVVFIGEIYSHNELRNGLEKPGFHFRMSSDTDVFLCADEAWGKDYDEERVHNTIDDLTPANFNKNQHQMTLASLELTS